jgi:hypothetical protein
MIFTHRPLQPEDIPECVKIMASHPVFGPRYVRFETAWENRKTSRIDGVRVHFIGLSDLMRNKKPQDLLDLANLKGET